MTNFFFIFVGVYFGLDWRRSRLKTKKLNCLFSLYKDISNTYKKNDESHFTIFQEY
jgi:hypothetical protein